ncbi:MAG: hypothetical protein KJO98_08295 [Rhodothermia bacterium]|nr:hypothetical protein [Rhodothermia bacterium]
MDHSEEILKVLQEIRDSQREHHEEYRRVAGQSVALQEDAVARQKFITNLYKKVLVAGGILVVILLVLILYLMRFFF